MYVLEKIGMLPSRSARRDENSLDDRVMVTHDKQDDIDKVESEYNSCEELASTDLMNVPNSHEI